MKKTIFRVTLFSHADDLCEKLVAMAAKANGGAKISLKDIKTVSDGNSIQYPSLYGERTAEIIGGNMLHIDRKIGTEYHTVCAIQEVEVFEMPETSPNLEDDLHN